ncbi:MAG: class I adenylate-forming enzyme family protein [Thermoleophilia bacterium]
MELAQGLGRLDDAHPPAAVYVVPTMLAQLPPGRAPGPGPRAVYCAGAALERAGVDRTRSRYPDTALVEYYGASELSFVAIRREGDGTPPGSVGRAFPGVRIDIRDEAGRTVPPGGVGTVWVHSDLVFQGYRGQAPASVARRDDEGWLTVGDLGSLDRDGFLRVAGRGTALIITGGANVQPEEVERVLCGAPGVSEAAVVGLPDPRWGQRVCALLVPRAGATLTRADVRAHVAAHLTQGKRPRHYAVAGALPLGRTGKVDREEVVRILAATPPEAELR